MSWTVFCLYSLYNKSQWDKLVLDTIDFDYMDKTAETSLNNSKCQHPP